MNKFKFAYDWRTAGNDAPEYLHTMADLALHVNSVNLMRNEDIWSKTVRKSVLVSAYPLAIWLAFSWWRLNWEPLPARPSVDWRMAHEMGASGHGFVWPRIIFASDCEMMQIWAAPSNENENQSVRYLNGLETPAFITLADFQRGAEDFINGVLHRLNAVDCQNTDLSNLWQLIQEDSADQESLKYRRIEAEMGYDPDECPEELVEKALTLEKKMGKALSELAPVYGKSARQKPLTGIEEIADSPGLMGVPTVKPFGASADQGLPWEHAAAAAGSLRRVLDNRHNMIDNAKMCELLGIKASDFEDWKPAKRNYAAIAVPDSGNRFKFVPRKKHPDAKRFELARFIGDYLLTGHTDGQWLASTDISTSRQKYQRAFAAEFLCPTAALQEFLQDDDSEDAVEDAAQHFQVSSVLINNRLNSFLNYADVRLPCQLNI